MDLNMSIGCLLRRAGQIFFLALIGFGNVQAQQVGESGLPGEWLQCLRKDDATSLYPEKFRDQKLEGFVRVKLSFERGDRPPNVELLSRAIPDGMLEIVKDYLASYRLPCLPADRAQIAVQEFRYSTRTRAGVTWTELRDVSESTRSSRGSCVRTPSEPMRRPSLWPGRRLDFGNLLLRMRFDTPDGPPQVTVLYNNVPSDFRETVLDYVNQYRAPCVVDGGEPLIGEQQFMLESSGARRGLALPDQDLFKFLERIKGIDKEQVHFDLNTMSCPFRVRWSAGMPIHKNWVSEIGVSDLNRTEFLAWLSGLHLDVSAEAIEYLLGASMVISVACGEVKLGK